MSQPAGHFNIMLTVLQSIFLSENVYGFIIISFLNKCHRFLRLNGIQK